MAADNFTIDWDELPGFVQDLFDYSFYYALLLPCLSAVGIAFNVIAIIILCQKNMRSTSTTLIAAQLVVDIVLLLSLIVIIVPAEWMMLMIKEFADNIPDIWGSISSIQQLFAVTIPLLCIAQTLSVWYALMLVIEQHMALTKAHSLSKLGTSGGMKAIIGVMSLAVIVNFFILFKYVHKKVRYSPVPIQRICLSELRTGVLGTYDRYVSIMLDNYIPYVILVGVLIATIVAAVRKRRADDEEYENGLDNPSAGQIPIIKGGRSLRIVFSFSFVFLLLHGGINAISIIATFSSDQDILYRDDVVPYCSFFPAESRFLYVTGILQKAYYSLYIAYAIVKFPLLALFGKQFRANVSNCFKKHRKVKIPAKNKPTLEEEIIKHSIATGVRTTIPVRQTEYYLNSSKHGALKIQLTEK